MATGFNIRDFDPEAFISDQRQGEGKGGDRGMSLQIIDDVLENSKGLFEENGLDDEIANKLKQLWISKLDASNFDAEKQKHVAFPQSSSIKLSTPRRSKKGEFSAKLKRRREESKTKSKNIEVAPEELFASSSILEPPKSVSLKKKSTIGGQVDGPNDTSDEEDDIGKKKA